jgi:hypothetical protein
MWTRCWASAHARPRRPDGRVHRGHEPQRRAGPGGGPAHRPGCRHRATAGPACAGPAHAEPADAQARACSPPWGAMRPARSGSTRWVCELPPSTGSRVPGPWRRGAGGLARLHASHKGSYGDVAVIGGAPGMAGAALLAASAACTTGPGGYSSRAGSDGRPGRPGGQPELMLRRPTRWTSRACGGDAAVVEAMPCARCCRGCCPVRGSWCWMPMR